MNSQCQIDLTGNWRETDSYEPFIKTSEPAIDGQQPIDFSWQHSADAIKAAQASSLCSGHGTLRTFFQTITLPSDDCELRIDYYPQRDTGQGFALNDNLEAFDGLMLNGTPVACSWQKTTDPTAAVGIPEHSTVAYAGNLDGGSGRPETWHWHEADNERLSLSIPLDSSHGENVEVSFTWRCSRAPILTLFFNDIDVEQPRYLAVDPGANAQMAYAHGIPFLTSGVQYSFGEFHVHNCPVNVMGPWDGTHALDCGNTAARRIHFLGMIHLYDRANGSWYTPKGDHGWSHFAGDKAGEILLQWSDGSTSTIPLVFGFNLWISRPWDLLWHHSLWGGARWNFDEILFGGHDEYRTAVSDSLSLVDGVRPGGGLSCTSRYVFSVDTDGREIANISFQSEPELHFHPVINGITIETDSSSTGLKGLPALTPDEPNIKPVTLDYIENREYETSLESLKHILYGFVSDTDGLEKPDIPQNYFGPQYEFAGTSDAMRAACFLYRNGPELGSYIADTGMGHTSPVSEGSLPSYQYSFGPWYIVPCFYKNLQEWIRLYHEREPGDLPGAGFGWARGIGEVIREAMAFGYDKFMETQVDWLDSTMFDETNPPHWHRSPGYTATITAKHQVGDTLEYGMRENDGHGNCMWGRYMVYLWQGKSQEWNKKHFTATEASVEWIQWQLDTDTIRPGVRKDVLFTESECADEGYDIYSSYACLYGLKMAIRMASDLGRTDLLPSWMKLYRRFQQGILDHLVEDSDFGPIWTTSPTCDWQDHSHKLVHIQLATDGDTYTPLQDYTEDPIEQKYLEISLNTYRYLMKDKNYNCLRTYGYGQGLIAQAALLLDEMEDADNFMQWLLRHAYLKHLSGWACPEGITVHRDGEYYVPCNGYEGQDSHIADATKAVRIMLGIDDNNPDHLRLIPRYPKDWTHMSISEFPVLTGSERKHLAYTYRKAPGKHDFSYSLEVPTTISVRLGPFAKDAETDTVLIDSDKSEYRDEISGDSKWVWVEHLKGSAATISITFNE